MHDVPRYVDERAQGETAATMLRTTGAVRERCGQLLARAREGLSEVFEIDEGALRDTAREALAPMRREALPRGVPLFGIWRSLRAGTGGRLTGLAQVLAGLSPPERTHARLDLTVVAWALGAPPPASWSYTEAATGQVLRGACGLDVAILHAFTAGLFSADPQRPWQAQAQGLRALLSDHLALALQASPANPLPDLAARVIRLRRLGEWMSEQPEVFGDAGRPAGLFDIIISPYGHGVPHTADVHAHDILSQLLVTLSGLSPQSPRIGGVPLGDCWPHRAVRGPGASNGWVPLHAAMQQLAASLLAPFAWGGVRWRGLESLTAPAMPSHALWLLQKGVLRLRDPPANLTVWAPDDQRTVEWRALTVALLDDIAAHVRHALDRDAAGLPVAWIADTLGQDESPATAAPPQGGPQPLTTWDRV